MNVPMKNTLLALLLALKDLEAPLSQEEQSVLADVAAQMYLKPNTWKSYSEPSLQKVIQANATLNQLYQAAKSQLDAVNGNIPLNLLPTETELEQALPPSNEPESRGFEPLNDGEDFESREIANMAISILATQNPPATAKKLSGFEQLKQFLQQSVTGK
jgi:hypothetical protein